MKLLQFPEMKTERLVLRKLSEADWEAISYLRTDKEVNRYVNRPAAETKEQALEFIAKIIGFVEKGESYYWAIARAGAKQMIGSICLWNFSADRQQAEVGYDLNPAFHGQGIMDEALKAVLHFGFQALALQRFEAFTHRDNEASKKLLIRNGFTLVAGKTDEDNTNNLVFEITIRTK